MHWPFNTTKLASSGSTTTNLSLAATAVGVADVSLTTANQVDLALPATAVAVPAVVRRVFLAESATATVPPVLERVIPIGFGVVAVGTANAAITGSFSPTTARADWLAEMIALLDEIVELQSGLIEIVSEADAVSANLVKVQTLRDRFYSTGAQKVSRLESREIARSLSKLQEGINASAEALTNFADSFGDDLQEILDNVDAIRVLLTDIPDEDTPGSSTLYRTYLALAATGTGAPNVTVQSIVAGPTLHTQTLAATARGNANVATSVIRVPPSVSTYAVNAPATALGVPNVTPTTIRFAPLVFVRNFPASAVGSANLTRQTIIAPSGTAKPIYVVGPNGVSTAVMAAYNCQRGYYMSQMAIDVNTVPSSGSFNANADGFFDGRTTNYTSRIQTSDIPLNHPGSVALDWEATPQCPYGMTNFALGIGGLQGTASTQDTAEGQGIVCINTFRADRPDLKWAFYDVPRSNEPGHFIPAFNSSFNAYMAQDTTISTNFWTRCDAIHQRAYVTYRRNNGTATNPRSTDECTLSQLITMLGNMANLGLRCSERSGWVAPVYPYLSRQYFNGSMPEHNQIVTDLEWMYLWAYHYCTVTYQGRSASGAVIWATSSAAPMTEAQLKAIYQGVNGLAYNPNMPRPS
jgi:hypothetical protein